MSVVPLPLPALTELELGEGEAALWWLGQSSFLLRLAGATVFVDPFLATHPERLVPPPFAPEEATEIDVVAITHDHLDHLDDKSLPGIAAASPDAAVVAPATALERLRALGVDDPIGLRPDEPLRLGALTIHPLPACHGDSAGDAYTLGGGRFLGYVFDGAGVRIYHAGDTIPFDGLAERLRALRPDVALLPINGRDAQREALGIVGNLDERDAVELAAAAGVDLLVPMHYDMFAANPGSPGTLVELARVHYPELAVLVLSRRRPFVYRRPA